MFKASDSDSYKSKMVNCKLALNVLNFHSSVTILIKIDLFNSFYALRNFVTVKFPVVLQVALMG
jgi:hypothetical protein